jgi:hypothetical protein
LEGNQNGFFVSVAMAILDYSSAYFSFGIWTGLLFRKTITPAAITTGVFLPWNVT